MGLRLGLVAVGAEKPLLFQLKLRLQSDYCHRWKGIFETKEITSIALDVLRSRCSCRLYRQNTITNAVFLCSAKSPGFILYRAQLDGTRTVSVEDFIQLLEDWVKTNPYISVQDQLLNVQSSCPVKISSFDDPPCLDESTTEPPPATSLKLEVISGIIFTAAFLVGVLVATIVIVLLRRKAVIASTNAIYNYVDNYQYKMYYKAEGLYEELNDYEPIERYGEKIKIDAYNKVYEKGLAGQYSHYEPISGGIYDISSCAAYETGQEIHAATMKPASGDLYNISPCVAYSPCQGNNAAKEESKIYENIADETNDECSQKSDHEQESNINTPLQKSYETVQGESDDIIKEGSSYEIIRDENNFEIIRGGNFSLPSRSITEMASCGTELTTVETEGL